MDAAEDRPGFPAYRRMVGREHYYRITAPDAFHELHRVGSRWLRHEVARAAYPEQLRIAEMLACAEGRFEVLDRLEGEAIFAR
jgi:hypothetical protein